MKKNYKRKIALSVSTYTCFIFTRGTKTTKVEYRTTFFATALCKF